MITELTFAKHFGQQKCQNYTRVVLAGKFAANNMVDVEEEILLQANLFHLLVLKRRHCQLQNCQKLQFWVCKNILEETSTWGLPNIRYRSNVSYHRLARRVSFLARLILRETRRVSRETTCVSFLTSALEVPIRERIRKINSLPSCSHELKCM